MTDIFALGNLKIGNFLLWITEPVFTDVTELGLYSVEKHLTLPYYSCYLTEIKTYKNSKGEDFTVHYYINLVDKLKSYDSYFDFSKPQKNINDEQEISSWLGNKYLQMPLWNLKKVTVQKLIQLLIKFDTEGVQLVTI